MYLFDGCVKVYPNYKYMVNVAALAGTAIGKTVSGFAAAYAAAKGQAVRAISSMGRSRASGRPLTEGEALTVSEYLTCVCIWAETMATLPLDLMQEGDDGIRKKARENPIYDLIRHRPNAYQTSFEFRFWLMCDAVIRRSGYAQIIRNMNGDVIELRPMLANRVTVSVDESGALWFGYMGGVLPDADVLRIQWMPCDGIIGPSKLALMSPMMTGAKAANDTANEYFSNGAQLTGFFECPDKLPADVHARFQKDMREQYSGQGNRWKAPILEGGMEFSPMALNAEETQLLETRKFNRSLIAGVMRIPAHLVNDLGGATYSNIEQQDLGFVKHSVRPWATNWEQRLDISLLTDAQRKAGLYFNFNFKDLLRGDVKSRSEAYAKMISCGVMTPNECRIAEDLPPLDGGESLYIQGAMRKLTDPYNASAPQSPTIEVNN